VTEIYLIYLENGLRYRLGCNRAKSTYKKWHLGCQMVGKDGGPDMSGWKYLEER